MSADFFLWGGFLCSLVWHLDSWRWVRTREGDSREVRLVSQLNNGLSGVALCCFGYLAFGTN